jgi:hypothetical protein
MRTTGTITAIAAETVDGVRTTRYASRWSENVQVSAPPADQVTGT